MSLKQEEIDILTKAYSIIGKLIEEAKVNVTDMETTSSGTMVPEEEIESELQPGERTASPGTKVEALSNPSAGVSTANISNPANNPGKVVPSGLPTPKKEPPMNHPAGAVGYLKRGSQYIYVIPKAGEKPEDARERVARRHGSSASAVLSV